ncbi:D-beta-hydroxybutyrate dehydrogenase [Lamellibrachia satsuma]|nr:D-beta-hydroxybutyrate dehydrogenase [Lamellibrachia satsuma]
MAWTNCKQMDGKDKVALVTGSTSGIGLAIALALAKRGCDVIVTGLNAADDPVVDAIKSQLSSLNVRAEYVGGDLGHLSDIERLCQESIKMFPGGVDILVNNAGFNVVGVVEDFPDDAWDDMVAVMLTAPFRLVKRLVSHMKTKGWGRIINICSQMAVISTPGKSVYSACKAGLAGFTRGVALEAAEYGVTCNAVCPTFADTPILRCQIQDKVNTQGISYELALKTFTDQVPTKKLCTVEQIADLVVFMTLSEASGMINGVDYLIDGGYVAQ